MVSANGIFTASAPGRMDVMGGIADYSGSLVLQMPIVNQTTVKLKLRDDLVCNVSSITNGSGKLFASFTYSDILSHGAVDFEYALRFFKSHREQAWAAYILGCALVLQSECGIQFTGADFELASNVPLGKGVSSSASVEVAVMKSLCEAYNLNLEGTLLPRLAQQVENRIVGAPCGLMDQLACYFGESHKLLPIVCQPDQVAPSIIVPEGVTFVGIDSGIRHHVGGASYGDVRCAAFMGYTIIARELGARDEDILRARETGEFSDLPLKGYLCNLTPLEFHDKFLLRLPESINGGEFLERFGNTTDSVTNVELNKTYRVRTCTSHPVYENQRVKDFVHALSKYTLTSDRIFLQRAGELMHMSHRSYSECGLGTDRTDEIVTLSQTKFSEGIYGARITGGGSGGTVCLLVKGDEGQNSVAALHKFLVEKYQQELMLFL